MHPILIAQGWREMINLLFTLLVVIAIFISILFIGTLIGWWKGANAIVLPGLGIILATPLMLILLLIIEFGVVILATVVSNFRPVE